MHLYHHRAPPLCAEHIGCGVFVITEPFGRTADQGQRWLSAVWSGWKLLGHAYGNSALLARRRAMTSVEQGKSTTGSVDVSDN